MRIGYEKGGLFQVRPLVAGPFDGLLNEEGGTVETGRVAVTDEEAFPIEVVGSTMACGLKRCFIAFQEKGASTIQHITTFMVKIGARYLFGAPYSHTIVALGTTTAVVPRYEEIIVATMLQNEWRLNGVATCKL